MKSALDNMVIKYLDKKSAKSESEKVKGLMSEFKFDEARAKDWVENIYPKRKDEIDKFNPRNAFKKNSHTY